MIGWKSAWFSLAVHDEATALMEVGGDQKGSRTWSWRWSVDGRPVQAARSPEERTVERHATRVGRKKKKDEEATTASFRPSRRGELGAVPAGAPVRYDRDGVHGC